MVGDGQLNQPGPLTAYAGGGTGIDQGKEFFGRALINGLINNKANSGKFIRCIIFSKNYRA